MYLLIYLLSKAVMAGMITGYVNYHNKWYYNRASIIQTLLCQLIMNHKTVKITGKIKPIKSFIELL